MSNKDDHRKLLINHTDQSLRKFYKDNILLQKMYSTTITWIWFLYFIDVLSDEVDIDFPEITIESNYFITFHRSILFRHYC